MCQFFSCVSNGQGKMYYFDWELRKKVLSGELQNYNPDSHTSIADYFGFKGSKEDTLNKYEFDPLTKKFKIDQVNTKNDSRLIKKQCLKLDFSTIVKPLIIKPIINPFDKKRKRITKKDLLLLKQWDSVWDSVWGYLGSFFTLNKWKDIKLKKGENPFQPCIDLWESGLVPSFDGNTWRLFGKNGKILKEISREDLRRIK